VTRTWGEPWSVHIPRPEPGGGALPGMGGRLVGTNGGRQRAMLGGRPRGLPGTRRGTSATSSPASGSLSPPKKPDSHPIFRWMSWVSAMHAGRGADGGANPRGARACGFAAAGPPRGRQARCLPDRATQAHGMLDARMITQPSQRAYRARREAARNAPAVQVPGMPCQGTHCV